MNASTILIDRGATSVASDTEWPQEPKYEIVAGPSVPTALSIYDFQRPEMTTSESVYYKAGANEVEILDIGTWVVKTTFTPATESHFRYRIFQAKLPGKWILEGVQPPTPECRLKAYEVWQRLYSLDLLPVRISASVEAGITFYYEHPTNGRTLLVETYNDLEVAALVNESSTIVYSENINAMDFDRAYIEFNV